jgi:actin-related protein
MSAQLEVVPDMNEKLAHVTLDFDAQLTRAWTTADCKPSYTLPDDHKIVIPNEKFRCTELLFNRSLNEFWFDGIHETQFESMMNSDVHVMKDLSRNIILSGGTTMFTGLRLRLEKEMIRLGSWMMKCEIKVIAQRERKYSAWIG